MRDGTPFIAALSPAAGPTTGGNIVEIQGGNFLAGVQTTVHVGTAPSFRTFVNSIAAAR